MKNSLRYFSLLLVSLIFLSIWIVKKGYADFPGHALPQFDAKIDMTHRDAIAAQKPQIILLGDSMVDENVDAPALSHMLGRTVYPISYPGSGSALWYLSIKNNILASPYKPQVLVILFRDSILTTPEYRLGGNELEDNLAGSNETLLLQLAYLNHMNPLQKMANEYFPLYGFGARIRSDIDYVNRYLIPHFMLHCGKRCVDTAFLNRFNFHTTAPPTANDPIAQSESILYTNRALDFHDQVGKSFLPEILRLCHENGVSLILVRGKTTSFSNIPKPAGLDKYISDLKNYLHENGVFFVDLESDPRLTTLDYVDRFHILPEARGTYTQMLADALMPLLP